MPRPSVGRITVAVPPAAVAVLASLVVASGGRALPPSALSPPRERAAARSDAGEGSLHLRRDPSPARLRRAALSRSGERAEEGAASPAGPVGFTNFTLHAGTGDAPVPDAVLIVQDGKVVYAGPRAAAEGHVPADVAVFDLKGAVVIPGLVDTHSHVGIFGRPSVAANADGNEGSGPVQPGGRAADAVNPDDPGVRMATAGGVTTANIMPGSGNVIGGQTLYVKLRGRSVEEMRVTGRLPDGSAVLGGLKMANGENPKGYGRTRQQAPFTRMKVAALQREQFVKAREYKVKKDTGEKVDRNIDLEPLVEVLEKKRTVHFHCHRADDILTAVRLSEEFGFELVLQHATEGYRVADILARKKIPASLTLLDSPGGKAETIGLLEENAAALEKAGAPLAINTDDSVTESRFYLRTGAIAVRGGLSEAAALKALTLTPARLMHLDHRVGSLEKGKDADFVVLSGPPFSTYTQVLETYIDGVKVFDRTKKADWTYQAGGFALPDAAAELPAPYKPLAAVKPARPPEAEPRPAVEPKKGTVLIRAGRIHTAAGQPIEDGVIAADNGVITFVGPRAEYKGGAAETVLTAREATPGLVDPFGVAGLSGAWNIPADQDQDELSDPNQADLRAVDGFNPHEPLLEFLRANGVTVVHATAGRAAVIAGTSAVFRTDTPTADAALKPAAGVLVNLGEVPKDAFRGKPGPQTRMAVAGLVRRAFAEAQAYRAKQANPDRKGGGASATNPKHDALVPALDRKVPVYFAAHRADDIATALRLADEFKLKPVVVLGTEAYRMAPALKKAGVPVVVHPTMQRAAGSLETLHAFTGTAAVLADAGVPVTIGTAFEGYVPKIRNLRHEAAMAAANGLGRDRALKAVTIDAAELLGVADKHGSIAVGKAADVVLYDGDPFEHATHVTHTVMGGAVVYRRADYLKLPLDRRVLPLLGGGAGAGCCLEGW